uniref:(northern house mosquito) hypothetical protein n=1 Tax=Culex pipiens TaxID=7175 RepID=A0A8D8B3V4_CULPI
MIICLVWLLQAKTKSINQASLHRAVHAVHLYLGFALRLLCSVYTRTRLSRAEGILVQRTSTPRQSRLVASVVCLALTQGMNPAYEPRCFTRYEPRYVPWYALAVQTGFSITARWVHASGECQTHNRGDEPRLSWCAGTMNQNTNTQWVQARTEARKPNPRCALALAHGKLGINTRFGGR